MQINNEYDVAIIGGGLAGLAVSIVLARSGHSVILFEKEKYPFHKVCGEYISLESRNFLLELGLPLDSMNLPLINHLFLSAPNGNSLTAKLPLGGFGISRFLVDQMLAEIARESGVHLLEETKVEDVAFNQNFEISFLSRVVTEKKINARVCCGAYGKKANLDIRWKRNFLHAANKKLDNYIGVKYHIQTDWEIDVIGLHNFENGYCGISKIEGDKYCCCYMTTAVNLKSAGNSIEKMQENILFANPHLKKIFTSCEILESFPVTISQINFNKKTQVEDHVLMLGDAAGMITPLCGNGMSIALHTAKISGHLIHSFLNNNSTREELEKKYSLEWKQKFSARLRNGRIIQKFFGSSRLSNFFVRTLKTFPLLSTPLVRMTHGKPF